ncbi:LPXTG cell wall anchor domain-containing protein [Clostridium sp. YIM B02506]|uniref:LPXTG cell wall anchor domain-containing protein n=1 Tax=Clostridium sp. YIM B02506 TaxID=2910680 RepID=UPI001EEEA667|nr:LPXTG cell wall anchor domain-containing protein [Clostridium sp. YIM B02506]
MKNIKKTASLFLAYLFVLSILPLGILAKTASAVGLPEYLKYSENYITTKLQYKDVSLIKYYEENKVSIVRITKDEKKLISNGYMREIDNRFIEDSKGVYDIYEEKYIKTNDEIYTYVKQTLEDKFGENVGLYDYFIRKVNDDRSLWISYNAGVVVENPFMRIYGVITPESKIVETASNQVNDKGMWAYGTVYDGPNYGAAFIYNYDKDGKEKVYELNNIHLDGYTDFKVVGNDVYVSTYTENGIVTLKYDVRKTGKQEGIKINSINFNDVSVDKDNNIWRAKEGYVQKFDGTNWTNIYKVDSRMNAVEVYDKNHMIVTGWWPEYKDEGGYDSKGIYTIINNENNNAPGNGQGEETPQKPTPGNNGGGSDSETDKGEDSKDPVVVDKGTDDTGNKFVEVSKLPNKDSVNSIQVDTKDSKAFTTEITDIRTVKEGKGSLNIKGGNTVINLPFSTINKDLLKDGSKIVLTSKVEDNSDITKNIKGLNKVFNFELSVVDKDNNVTAIHQFKDGQAEITITLSDDDLKGLNKEKLSIFYYNEETKQFEVMDTKVDGNNVTFKTPHFSKYIIAEKADENTSGGETQNPPQENNSSEQTSNEKELPQTGSLATQNQVLAIGMLILIAGAATLYSKRKRA